MKRETLTGFVATLFAVTLLVAISPAAAAPMPGAPWIEQAPADKVLPDLTSGIARRPAVLLETDYLVYGPGTGFTTPNLTVTINDRNYAPAVNVYLYWQNRATGALAYYSLATGQFTSQERDLFGIPGVPAKVLTPDLNNFQLFGPNGALGGLPSSVPTATGQYQFVFEIRNADSGQPVARGNAMFNFVDGVQAHSGTLSNSETWTNNFAHFIAAPVNVFSPATLTIQPGTVVLGSAAGQGTLVVRQGARINASGTADLPIIMTSELPVGQRAPGDWGGLVINGFAPTNQNNPAGEGNSGPYGGNDPNDNSGTLRYVRVEFAGILFSDQNELNGIALQGVGRGTTIEYIQIHRGQDDGLEFFGGTADAKYVLITGANDDSLDWTFGWQGRMQYVVVVQNAGNEDRAIEADNFESNPNALPRSAPSIANATFISNAGLNPSEPSEVVRLRRGTGGNITHTIAAFGPEEGVRVTEDETLAILGTELRWRNSFFYNNNSLTDSQAVADYINAAAQGNSAANAQLINPQSTIQPDVAPIGGSPARNAGALPAEFQNDGFFDNVTFAGGVNPNNPWTEDGWVTYSQD